MYEFDSTGKILDTQNDDGNTVTLAYNSVTTTDAKGNVNTKIYDKVGRLSQVKVGSATTAYTYYDNGNLKKLTYPNGLAAEYTYYADNKLRTLANKNGSTILSAYNYAYDASGNRTTVLDIDGTTTYAYDALNRLKSVTEPYGKVTAYTFDTAGNRTNKAVTANGSTVTTAYAYNAQNQLTGTIKTSDSTITGTRNIYDNNGNELSEQARTSPKSAQDTDSKTLKVSPSPEPSSPVTSEIPAVTDNPQSNSVSSSSPKPSAPVTSDTPAVTDNQQSDATASSDTASLKALSSEDITGGDTTDQTATTPDTTAEVTPSPEPSPSDSGTVTDTKTVTITDKSAEDTTDQKVAVTGSGQSNIAYTYNAFNQLISASVNGTSSSYTYGGDGLRAGKAVTSGGSTTTTKYAYEYDKVVLELDGSGNQTAYNVYGGNTLISRTVNGETLYYLYNGHGDVVQLTDAGGNVVMTYKYDAFGNVTSSSGAKATPYRYSGYRFDDETGLYYLNARYYNPVVARFISADTYYGQQTDPLSLNLYTYCHNEPIMYWDPTGHVVTVYDAARCSSSQIATIKVATDAWKAASAKGDTAGMAAAHAQAEAARSSAGYSSNSSGYSSGTGGTTSVYLGTGDTGILQTVVDAVANMKDDAPAIITSKSTNQIATVSNNVNSSGSAYLNYSQVQSLQKALNFLGIRDGKGNSLSVDGIYGANTTAAVKKYQAAYGLQVDGVVGPQTWNSLCQGEWTGVYCKGTVLLL